ncbi:MAG: GFA family protein [Myxococcales bacterium]|nr:GFA family protein [Myxococcales bacterium]
MTDAPSDDRAGRCLCGAVRFTARGVQPAISACHCDMCRRWSSGPFFAVPCARFEVGRGEALQVRETSAWAERGFCRECGSGIFYRITADGPHRGATNVSLGALDDQSGLHVAREWYIDRRPDAYELVGDDHEKITAAQVAEMFGV